AHIARMVFGDGRRSEYDHSRRCNEVFPHDFLLAREEVRTGAARCAPRTRARPRFIDERRRQENPGKTRRNLMFFAKLQFGHRPLQGRSFRSLEARVCPDGAVSGSMRAVKLTSDELESGMTGSRTFPRSLALSAFAMLIAAPLSAQSRDHPPTTLKSSQKMTQDQP